MQVFFRFLTSPPALKGQKTLPFCEILRYNRCHLYDVQNV
jgi:hypothetical protein